MRYLAMPLLTLPLALLRTIKEAAVRSLQLLRLGSCPLQNSYPQTNSAHTVHRENKMPLPRLLSLNEPGQRH
jgi:hypothetical protein